MPRSDALEAQEKAGFKARMIDVPATARRLEVTFTEAMPAPMEEPEKSGEADEADEGMKKESGEPASSENAEQPEQPDAAAAMSLSLLKFVGQASLVDDAMLPS